MIKNNTKKVIYITNMEFFMFVSDKNLRCSFYYIERNPTFMKNNLKKDTWKELRLHVRLQTFGKKCIEEGGSEINIPITELEIHPRKTYYIIMELDSPGWIDILANSSGKHYEYKNKWTSVYKKFHHKIMGYTLGDLKSDSPSSSPDNKTGIRSMNFGYLRNFKFTVNQSKFYYFIIKSKEPCYVHINDQELIVSKKCPKGSRGSKKLQTGEVYTMSLYFTKDE